LDGRNIAGWNIKIRGIVGMGFTRVQKEIGEKVRIELGECEGEMGRRAMSWVVVDIHGLRVEMETIV
jgi:hypothetical protein